jgi:acetoin utilization protein AcuC
MSMSALTHFYYHPRMLAYDFGPQHPLKPERLRRAVLLLESYGVTPIDPGEGGDHDVLRVHDGDYVDAVANKSSELSNSTVRPDHRKDQQRDRRLGLDPFKFGFSPMSDNPPFAGMYEASLAYVSGTARAAEAVRDGAPLAFGLAGGLHHAHRERASGFCIFNDPAVAIHILREKFERVAYVDIDVHHGDGVQWMFYDDPHVLTCSIHQDPRTLFPGAGFLEETGEAFTSLNVPLAPGTTGDVWLWAFENGVMPALEKFRPEAIVLQMGTDTHYLDPLAHINNTSQEWVQAVRLVRDFGVPIVALGGGGYEITCVPRMWTAACLTLGRLEFDDELPDFATEWGMTTFSDRETPGPRGSGRAHAEAAVEWLSANLIPNLP